MVLPVFEAILAGVVTGALNRMLHYIETHGIACNAQVYEAQDSASESSAVVEATPHFDPGAHFSAL